MAMTPFMHDVWPIWLHDMEWHEYPSVVMFKPYWLVDMCHVSTCSCITMVKPQWLQVHACVMFLPDKVKPLLSSSVSCICVLLCVQVCMACLHGLHEWHHHMHLFSWFILLYMHVICIVGFMNMRVDWHGMSGWLFDSGKVFIGASFLQWKCAHWMVNLSSLCGYHMHLPLVHAWAFNEHVGQLVWVIGFSVSIVHVGL